MKRKITTKTIIISIIALLVLGVAITGIISLFKQSDEVITTGKSYEVTSPEIIQTSEYNQIVDNENQEEPAPTTIEREKVISETIILGWNKLYLNSVIPENELEINYNNIDENKEENKEKDEDKDKDKEEIPDIELEKASINVSKTSKVKDINKNGILDYGDKITYTIKATNSGDENGTVTFKDTDLKSNIDNNLVKFVEQTGYSGTNDELISNLADEDGISLIVNGKMDKIENDKVDNDGNVYNQIVYTVEVKANAGDVIKNSVQVISGGKEDNNKTQNEVEGIVNITENSETIKGKNIVIVMDLSASMNDLIDGKSKLEAAKDAAQGFISNIFDKDAKGESGTKLSIVTFNYGGNEKSSGDTSPKYVGTKVLLDANGNGIVTNKSQATSMNNAIEAIKLGDDLGTNMGAALKKAEQQLTQLSKENDNEKVIIFLGDGDPSTGGTENTESAIIEKATTLKKAGVDIYTIGFGLHQKVEVFCPALFNSDCEYEHHQKGLLRYHWETVDYEDAIRILRNMASGKEGVDKENYAKESTGAEDLIKTFAAISSSISATNTTHVSSNGKVVLSDSIYADDTHPITINIINADGEEQTPIKIKTLPTDGSGKVIKENNKYYLDLSKFNAEDKISIEYFSH